MKHINLLAVLFVLITLTGCQAAKNLVKSEPQVELAKAGFKCERVIQAKLGSVREYDCKKEDSKVVVYWFADSELAAATVAANPPNEAEKALGVTVEHEPGTEYVIVSALKPQAAVQRILSQL